MQNEIQEQKVLLERAGALLNSILDGLDGLDVETKKRIMEPCGEACARSDADLEIASKIAEATTDEEEILRRANDEIPWCGTWTREDDVIQTTCASCGCPLVRSGVVRLSGTLCYCSTGWVRKIFETLLRRPVNVRLEESIGRGDQVCKFVVHT